MADIADVYEKDLAQKSSLTVNDFIRVVGADNASYKQLVSDVAKKIIENYTSSLNGRTQSVQTAIERTSLYCHDPIYIDSNTTIYAYVKGQYNSGKNNGEILAVGCSDAPTSVAYRVLWFGVAVDASADISLFAWANNASSDGIYMTRFHSINDTALNPWVHLPTRAEIDAHFPFIAGIASGTAPKDFIKSSLESGKLPYDTTFCAKFSAGYYFWGTGYFYKASNQVYGSAIVGRPNYIYKVNCYADTWTQEVIPAVPSAVTVTASANVVIDTNKSYKCGNTLFLNVKGHTTANLSNASLFTFAGASVNPASFTFGIPMSDSAWSINGITYGYVNANGIVGTVGSGKYFHIAQAFLCE